ncbi:hypothetical protein Tco_0609641, partial [Tanacetum coccineum]
MNESRTTDSSRFRQTAADSVRQQQIQTAAADSDI